MEVNEGVRITPINQYTDAIHNVVAYPCCYAFMVILVNNQTISITNTLFRKEISSHMEKMNVNSKISGLAVLTLEDICGTHYI